MSYRLFIVAGESSGDLHGFGLVRALREREPSISVAGLGGPLMASEGVRIVQDVTAHAAVGISEAVAALRTVRAAYVQMVRLLDHERPDAVVLIDYPEFNLRFARQASRRGIPVVYYISPQLWAWREWRIRSMKRYVDRILVILPFERDFYEAHGVEATFVGHPLLDVLKDYRHGRRFADQLGFPKDTFILGLLPGSRRKEIEGLLPVMLAAAERISESISPLAVGIAPAPSVPTEQYRTWQSLTSLPLHLVPGKAYELMAAADLLLVASGTATLEAGIIGTPMIVTYKLSALTWLLAKLLVRNVRYCSLTNLVADRALVPELLQHDVTPERIAEVALSLTTGGRLDAMAEELAHEVRPRLGGHGASGRAADEILDLLRWSPPNA